MFLGKIGRHSDKEPKACLDRPRWLFPGACQRSSLHALLIYFPIAFWVCPTTFLKMSMICQYSSSLATPWSHFELQIISVLVPSSVDRYTKAFLSLFLFCGCFLRINEIMPIYSLSTWGWGWEERGCDGSADTSLLKFPGAKAFHCKLVILARLTSCNSHIPDLVSQCSGEGKRVEGEHCLEAWI